MDNKKASKISRQPLFNSTELTSNQSFQLALFNLSM